MLRFTPFLFALLLLPGLIFAQNTLRGKVIYKDNKASLPGTYVFMHTTEGETILATVTDNSGYFEIRKPTEKIFVLEISFIGYEAYSRTFDNVDIDNLGTIELLEE